LESVDQETWTLTDVSSRTQQWLVRGAGERNAYLTTFGRRSRKAHRIEIWFAVDDGRVFLLSGGRDRSDWVKNLRAHAGITIEFGGETHAGTARILDPGTPEDQRARELLVEKYRQGNDLDEWGRTSLPIMIEFNADTTEHEFFEGTER
jgi:deazaflavin-dependent oxidoreductase (nitroreductase family)